VSYCSKKKTKNIFFTFSTQLTFEQQKTMSFTFSTQLSKPAPPRPT